MTPVHETATVDAAEPVVERSTDAPAPSAAVPPVAGLMVGAADDRAEIEADVMADRAISRLHGQPGQPHAHAPGAVRRSPSPRAAGAIGLAGGAVDAPTERRISASQGRGARLDSDVADRMGRAFGRDFSGVQVHDDGEAHALNRQLSSTAFTLGNDVYFSRGAYRPGDASGDHLIAHELAHVVQQSSSARRSIRRAVGFEFETSLITKKKLPTGALQAFPKATVLKQYDGFRMETDENSSVGSTIEFVVDPPVQEDNRKKLVAIMKKMYDVTAEIAKHEDTDYINSTPWQNWDATHELRDFVSGAPKDAWVLPRKYPTANPQVTGGIDFAKLIDMMSEIGNGDKGTLSNKDKSAASELERIAPDKPSTYAGWVKAAGGPPGVSAPSKQLQGLAALMVSYLVFGSAASGDKLNYAKLISNSLMVRTDFGALFAKLPDSDYGAIIKDPTGFVTWILTIARLQNAPDVPVFERGIRKSYRKADPDYNVADPDPGLAITRRDWILRITMGEDLLSAKTNPALAAKLEGLGALGGKFDAIGPEAAKKPKNQSRTGTVLEFRNMQKAVEHTQWSSLALGIFDYIVGLNNR